MDMLEIRVGKNIVSKWEEEDGYYRSMDDSGPAVPAGPMNRKARKYPYLEMSEFTLGANLSVKKPSNIPIEGPLTVVYLDGRSDAGLPHTRGMKGIALPVFLLWQPSEKTIQHEIVHLSQKQNPQRWWAWYQDVWNFRRAKEEEFMGIPLRWRSRRRINPDTLGTPYTIWQDRWIPLSVFINEKDPDLRYCKRGFWDCKLSQWTWETPTGWVKTFGSGFNDEHPNEIAAHWIDGSAGKEKQEYFNIRPV
jgi:hypothetical protein